MNCDKKRMLVFNEPITESCFKYVVCSKLIALKNRKQTLLDFSSTQNLCEVCKRCTLANTDLIHTDLCPDEENDSHEILLIKINEIVSSRKAMVQISTYIKYTNVQCI